MCQLDLENLFRNPVLSCKFKAFTVQIEIGWWFPFGLGFHCSFNGITVSHSVAHWLWFLSSLIANGDLISPACRLLIPRKALNQWDHVLQMVTEKITLRSGAVHR